MKCLLGMGMLGLGGVVEGEGEGGEVVVEVEVVGGVGGMG